MHTGPELGAAIDNAIRKKGVTKVAVATHFGVRPPSVQDWIKRGTIGKDKLPALWDYFSDVAGPEHWGLVGGSTRRSTDPFPEGRPILALHAEDAIPEGVVLIKESRVRFSCGDGHAVTSYEEIEESLPATYRRDWFVEEGMNPAKVRRFQVKGSSMEPLLYHCDTVLVNMAETDVRDGLVYALRYGDELRVKRCYRKLDGGLILHSENPDHRPRDEEIPAALVDEHISIIGRVREKAGKGGL